MLCLDRFWILHSLTVFIPLYFFFALDATAHCILFPGSDVSWPSSDPCGLYNLAQQALISKSRLFSFTLLGSSHHRATSSTPKGGNNPHPRRTEQSTAGVHRPHMHPSHTGTLIYTPPGAIFRFSGSSASSARLYVCAYTSVGRTRLVYTEHPAVCDIHKMSFFHYISRAYGLLIGGGLQCMFESQINTRDVCSLVGFPMKSEQIIVELLNATPSIN